ncbi:MAG: branched-chain amino acid ABC transporter permease [Desulfobacterales bacterium]|jgi:branched-chain amino acid transport system permease protein|nr:branched-chain amino acid ABC transporter permease [Deltaproteobacteria bacterium]
MTEPTPVQLFRQEEKQKQFRSGVFFLKSGLLIFFLVAPFLLPSFKTLDLALKILIFAVLVASFDILLGYTGILSFGHVMFFGIGGYSVAMLIGKYGNPSYLNLFFGFLIAVAITSAIALLVSFLSLRVRAIFFAMVTLAIAEFAIILASKLSGFTGGEDGIIMSMPGIFKVSYNMGSFIGLEMTGRVMTYYFIFIISLVLFLLMVRFIHSPLGRVMQAIRDNEPRAEAIGYKTFIFKTISICFGCLVATILGGLYVMWVGYANPESVLGIPIMLDVLLMVIVGGMGTLYGGLAGAAFLMIAHTFLPDLQNFAKDILPNAHFLHAVLERWLLIFGILFILVVFFFPKGIIGSVQDYAARRKMARSI